MCVHMNTHMYIRIHIYIYICTYNECVHIYKKICTYIYKHILIYLQVEEDPGDSHQSTIVIDKLTFEINELKSTLDSNKVELNQNISKLENEIINHIEKNTDLNNIILKNSEEYEKNVKFFENDIMMMKNDNENQVADITKNCDVRIEQYKMILENLKNNMHENSINKSDYERIINENSILIEKLEKDMILHKTEYENMIFEKDEFIKSLMIKIENEKKNETVENDDKNLLVINEYENKLKILQDNYNNIEILYDNNSKKITMFEESKPKMDELCKNQIEKVNFLNLQLEYSSQNQIKVQEKDTQIMVLRQQVLTYVHF
jgi:hypothetical protein